MSIAEIALLEGRYPAATRIVTPTPWALLSIAGGWAAGVPKPQFRIDAQGTVHLRGQINGGAIPALFSSVPPGFEPAFDMAFPVITTDTAGPTTDTGTVSVLNAAGAMAITQGIASIDFAQLDGISWSVFA